MGDATVAQRRPASAEIVGRAGGPRRNPRSSAAALRLVAHELRAHVAVLDGYAELLGEGAVRDDPARFAQALGGITDRVRSLRSLSDHLSSAVRVDGGGSHRERVDLREVGHQAAAEVADQARSRGCAIVVEEPGEARVDADRFQILTAIRNLLENACRHGPPGGAVRLRAVVGGDRVRVWVHDQGPGLSALGRRAFEPLTRGQGAPPEGMGIGLSLVHDVACRHGGRAFWGRDRNGSWVGLEFPRHQAA